LQPANGAHIRGGSDGVTSVTLVVAGTLSDGAIFETALDPEFSHIVDRITYLRTWCGRVGFTCADGQTSIQLTYEWSAGDHYWHASAGPTGEFSTTFKFTIF
jgi:hypothetical protein